MSSRVEFTAAAALPLAALAELYTRAFAGYAYPVHVTAAALARRVAAEQIDLARSPVIRADGEPAGVALLGVRGPETNCAGFGIVAAHRGRGLAHALLAEHLRLAREAGGRRISLMVLADNAGAVRAYLRAGMAATRRLLWLEWRGPRPAARAGDAAVAAVPADLLARCAALPRAAPFWQRDARTLRALDGLEGWAIAGAGAPRAYAIVDQAAGGPAQIADMAAEDRAAADSLIGALQSRYGALCINEPEESPLLAPLRAAGFAVALTRLELGMAL